MQFVLKENRVKVIFVKHDQVEETNAESQATDNHGEEKHEFALQLQLVSICFFIILHCNQFKEQMNCELRQVLQEERETSHEFTKHNWLIAYGHHIVDAERIKDSGQEHVLSDKGKETV